MSHNAPAPTLDGVNTSFAGLGSRSFGLGIVVGVVTLGTALWLGLRQDDALQRFGFSYLLAFAFFLSLSLGALFFVALQHVTRASWSVTCRRIAEVIAANLPLLALLAVPLMLLAKDILPWAVGDPSLPSEMMRHKEPFLNLTSFYVRWAAYFAIWIGFAVWFWRKSVQQDTSGEPGITNSLEKRSGLALLLFALSVNFASYDLLMSLDPTWFSTMFGPYFFAGSVLGFMATLTMITFYLQRNGRLEQAIHVEHLHDYGKLLFAFVFFWAYLAFSQYMLIWYANIPEETAWLLRRQENGWGWVGLILLFGHWLLPFAALMSRWGKRHRRWLLFWAVWVFVMHWVDLYWIIMPEITPHDPTPHLMDFLCFFGVAGFYVAGLSRIAGRAALVPERDPRLVESLAFENG